MAIEPAGVASRLGLERAHPATACLPSLASSSIAILRSIPLLVEDGDALASVRWKETVGLRPDGRMAWIDVDWCWAIDLPSQENI